MRPLYLLFGLLVFSLLVGGCISSSQTRTNSESFYTSSGVTSEVSQGSAGADYFPSVAYDEGVDSKTIVPSDPSTGSYDAPTYQTQTGTIRIEVTTDSLDDALADAKTILASKNANVLSVYYDEYYGVQRYYLTFKVDPETFDATLSDLGSLGKVTNLNVQIEDVTREYTDLDIRLKSKHLELERLYALYNKSEAVEDLLAVEREVSRITTEIELLTTQKENLEGRIFQSTVTLELSKNIGVPEMQEAQLGIKVEQDSLDSKLVLLKEGVALEGGDILSLQFNDGSLEKHYDLSVRVSSSRFESTLERLKALGEVKYLTTNINEENRPEQSIIRVKLVEEKPSVQTSLISPLDDVGKLFLTALSFGILAVVGLVGLLIPLGVVFVIAKKLYSLVRGHNLDKPARK